MSYKTTGLTKRVGLCDEECGYCARCRYHLLGSGIAPISNGKPILDNDLVKRFQEIKEIRKKRHENSYT